MINRPTLPVLAFVLMLIAGCSSGSDSVTQTTSSKGGTLYGYVKLYDPNGQPHFSSAGAKVVAINKSFSAITNDSGFWAMNGVPAGVYRLKVYPPSGGWYQWYSADTIGAFQFVGADSLLAYQFAVSYARPFKAKLNLDSLGYGIYGNPVVKATYTILDSFSSIKPSIVAYAGTDSTFRKDYSTDDMTSPGQPWSFGHSAPSGTKVYFQIRLLNQSLICFDTTKGSTYDPNITAAQTPVMYYIAR